MMGAPPCAGRSDVEEEQVAIAVPLSIVARLALLAAERGTITRFAQDPLWVLAGGDASRAPRGGARPSTAPALSAASEPDLGALRLDMIGARSAAGRAASSVGRARAAPLMSPVVAGAQTGVGADARPSSPPPPVSLSWAEPAPPLAPLAAGSASLASLHGASFASLPGAWGSGDASVSLPSIVPPLARSRSVAALIRTEPGWLQRRVAEQGCVAVRAATPKVARAATARARTPRGVAEQPVAPAAGVST